MPLVRSASLNLLVEILIRISIFSMFCYMETLSPFERVIHDNDMETDYKYPHKDSYVPGSTLWIIVLSVPCALSLLAWAGCSDCNDAFEILLSWSLALGINGVITDFFKLLVGRPRPDYFYRCYVDGVLTPDRKCNGDPAEIMDGRKSFPSGHSSLSFCSLGTVSVWLCGRLALLSGGRGSAARLVACLAPLGAAAAIAVSRVNDYHHHWQDVLVGSILGFSTAVFVYRQYYNPLSSELSGIPYIVSNSAVNVKYGNGKDVSPAKDVKVKEESTPLLNGKKDDKWI